jgi:hypothetical protein
VRYQLAFDVAPACLSLGVVRGITEPGIAGQRASLLDALPTGQAGVLVALASMDDQEQRETVQGQGFSQHDRALTHSASARPCASPRPAAYRYRAMWLGAERLFTALSNV